MTFNRWIALTVFTIMTCGSALCQDSGRQASAPVFMVDAHQDCLRRVLDRGDDLGQTYGDEQGNIPQWRRGGFNVIWMSVWVDPRKYTGSQAVERAQNLIRAYRQQVETHPADVAACQSAAEIRTAVQSGKIAALLGVEGGVAINNDLNLISRYRQQGVRYMTLTWRGNLPWAGSSQSDNPSQGLTQFGRRVVNEMNRVGMIVDLSHVSDRTFYDAIEETSRPVIVSHSNARLLSSSPRNITDGMLAKLRENGGVVGVNFSGDFLKRTGSGDLKLRAGPATIDTVVEQIDHIVQVAGVESVGLGTDYDGGIRPAIGLANAADAPKLLQALRVHGYTEEAIRAIAGENFMRVIEANDSPMQGVAPQKRSLSQDRPDFRM